LQGAFLLKLWPFPRKNKAKDKVKDSYNGEISLDQAIELIANEIGATIGGKSGSGFAVNEETAMRFSAVYACVSLLAGTIAALSCEVFKRVGTDERDYAFNHPAFKLVNTQPNNFMSAYIFWETIGYDCFLSGNAYGVIGRNASGVPSSVSWLPSRSVTPFYNPDKTRIWYRVPMAGGKTVVFDQDDILHFPCIGWDGLQGMSPIKAARESIGLGLAGENFNSKYFTNGVQSDIAISFPKPLGEEAKKAFKKYLKDRYAGPDNARIPLVLSSDAKVTNLQMNAEDAQMMHSRVFQIEDICRFYGVPLHLVSSTEKSTSWGSGIEEQTIGFVKFTLRKRVKMMEQEINRKLIRSNQYFCKFNMESLLRGDVKTRAEFYKVALGGNQVPGFMTVNELRKLENRKPFEDPKYDQPYEPPQKDETKEPQPLRRNEA
jgi:HK97 family phage portal protein